MLSPEPTYLYDYEPCLLKCCSCQSEFYHYELQTDYDQDYYNECVCPKCGEHDCCTIEYEDIRLIDVKGILNENHSG